MNSKILLTLAVASIASLPFLHRAADPNDYEGGRSKSLTDRAARNSSAAAIMFGEVRASMSDILLIKTERYLHNGVAYVPHMDKGVSSVTEEAADYDTHQQEVGAGDHDHDHGGEPLTETLIPTVDNDFRGFIGELHRQVKPWQDPSAPHVHTSGDELLPWYRVMTIADPNSVRGFSLGSWWLKRRNPDEALRFIDEGIAKNPEAFQLHYMKGQVLYEKARQHLLAGGSENDANYMELMQEIRSIYSVGAEHAFRTRPDNYVYDDLGQANLVDYEEEDRRAVMRLAVLFERRYGDPLKARSQAARFLEKLKEDGVIERMLESQADLGVAP